MSRELGEVQSKLNQVTRIKASLTTQNDELKRQVDEESKVKNCRTELIKLSLWIDSFANLQIKEKYEKKINFASSSFRLGVQLSSDWLMLAMTWIS